MEFIIVLLIGLIGAGLVLAPVFRSRSVPAVGGPALFDDDDLDREVERYREAVRAGTVCGRCRFANPAGSRYCADCGKPLMVR